MDHPLFQKIKMFCQMQPSSCRHKCLSKNSTYVIDFIPQIFPSVVLKILRKSADTLPLKMEAHPSPQCHFFLLSILWQYLKKHKKNFYSKINHYLASSAMISLLVH